MPSGCWQVCRQAADRHAGRVLTSMLACCWQAYKRQYADMRDGCWWVNRQGADWDKQVADGHAAILAADRHTVRLLTDMLAGWWQADRQAGDRYVGKLLTGIQPGCRRLYRQGAESHIDRQLTGIEVGCCQPYRRQAAERHTDELVGKTEYRVAYVEEEPA
jgi:hypothetical protein